MYRITHGGAILLQDFYTLRDAYDVAFSIKCSSNSPTHILKKTGPNAWDTVVEIKWNEELRNA
jgi:hypothetical protein